MTTTLFRRGTVIGLPGTGAVAVRDGRVAWVGADVEADGYDGADEVVDLAGSLVTPGFVDAHCHVVQTGDQLSGLDLSGAASLAEASDRLAVHSRDVAPDALIVGQGWDESSWPEGRAPTGSELERASAGRRVWLARVDGHSAIASSALLAAVPEAADMPGYDAGGRVEREAKRLLFDAVGTLIPLEQRAASARVALAEMARLGVVAFHENAAPHIGPAAELPVVAVAAREVGLLGTYYWGSHLDFDAVDRFHSEGVEITGLAGDLTADGALGSRSAALNAPYADDHATCGHAYLDADAVAAHVEGCTERGLQAGFHCIGDAALDAVAAGFRSAAQRLGADRVRAARHRVEHCELPTDEVIATFADLGVVASVQPMFDHAWGGPDRMYATRLGDRWAQANPLRSLAAAGVALAFGSDAPVTGLDPWQAIRAAVHHRTDAQGLTPSAALAAHTVGGWHAARIDGVGTLAVGAPAHLAFWDTDVDPTAALAVDAPSPRCRRLVVAGRTVMKEES